MKECEKERDLIAGTVTFKVVPKEKREGKQERRLFWD